MFDIQQELKKLPAKPGVYLMHNSCLLYTSAVLSGNTILFLGGEARAILFSSKLFPTRGVQNADQEVAIVGPKDSFTESLRMNTALIRRRIRDTRLKVIQKQIGTRSKTDYALMYIEDLVQKDILNKIQKQMDKICVCLLYTSKDYHVL